MARSVLVMALVLLGAVVAAPAGIAPPLTPNVGVTNKDPAVQSVTVAATVNPTAGGSASVSISTDVRDPNGYNDLDAVTIGILKPDGSTQHVAQSAASQQSGNGARATYSISLSMAYHDPPGTYYVKVLATDRFGASADNTGDLASFSYTALTALGLGAGALELGSSVAPNSTGSIVPLDVLNHGNVAIDVQLSGTALAHASESASIQVGNLRYSTASDMTGSAALGATPSTLASFDLAPGAGSTKPLHWQFTVPSGAEQWVPSGDYAGSVTIAAVAG